MRLMSMSLKFVFAEALAPFVEIRNIVRVASGTPSAELQGAPILIDSQSKKCRIILEFRGLTFMEEGIVSVQEGIGRLLDIVTKLNAVSNFPRISERRCESIFIEPFTLPFHELVILTKDKYLKSNAIVDYATDIGIVFDQHEKDIVKHSNIGPMEREQFRSHFQIFPTDDIPERFGFVSLAYSETGNLALDEKELKQFLEVAARWQNDQAEKIFNFLRGKGE